MTTEVRTPFHSGTVVELSDGGLWRKQVLRFGTIWYTGRDGKRRKLTFDQKYGKDLIDAFKSGAYEQVPFQFADGDNRHNNDPTRTQGEVVGLSLSADGSGVDGVLRTWGEGTKAVEQNPKLGVSARILEGLETSDGRQFPRAIQHVLATVDPQVRGMRPWERVSQVDLSTGSVAEAVDLSNAHYEGGAAMGDQNGDTVTLELSTALAELLQRPDTAARLERMLEEDEGLEALTDQLADELDESDEEDEEELDDEEERNTDLSRVGTEAVELANAQLDTLNSRVIELTNQLTATRVQNEVDGLLSRGLAPAVIEAARPLLGVESGAVELSNGVPGQAVDPGQAMRDVLETVIDLAQSGHLLVDLDDERGSMRGSDSENSKRDALVDEWSTTYGD